MPILFINEKPHSDLIIEHLNVTENGEYAKENTVFDNVKVNVPQPTIEDLTITANGEYIAPSGKAYGKVTANVPAPANALFKQTLSDLPSPIATFTGADAPLDSLKASIEGVQDLHGYDSPWVGGAGKNKAITKSSSFTTKNVTFTINSDGSIKLSGTADTTGNVKVTDPITVKAGTTYTVSIGVSASVIGYGISGFGIGTYTTTPTNDYSGACVQVRIESGTTYNTTIYPQIELGSTATSYESYSNICPISGWTGCEVNRTGKNLCDKKDATSLNGGILNLTGNGTFGYVKANNTYTFSFDVLESNSNNVQLRLNNGSGSLRNWTGGGLVANTRVKYTFTATEDGLLNFWANSGAFTPNTKVFDNIQLEIGEETAYEPYNGNTYTIPFKDSSDNPITVYDGENDITGGSAEFDKLVIDLGDLTWSVSTDAQGQFFQTPAREATGIKPGTLNCICSCYEVVSSSSVNNGNIAVGQTGRIYVRDNNYSTASDFKTGIAGQTLAYELETPISMQFDPIALRSDGVTNISVNCGEVTELKYFSETP